jgi:hypothetical protein
MKNSIALLATALLLAASGCSPKTPTSGAITAKAASAGAANAHGTNQVAWNWDAYPAVKKMRLGTLPCTLQPRSQITIQSTLAGSLKLYLDQPQTNLPAGAVWGEFEPTIFEAEASALEEGRVKLDEREKIQTELELPRERLKLERQVEDMQRRVAMLRLLSTNKELADLTLSVGSDNASMLRPDSLSKAETELQLVNQSLTYLRETNTAMLGVDLPGMRSDWQRRKLEFERRRAQATLKMPFNGQLTVSLPLAEGVAEYPVNVGQELGVARDLSVVRLRVAVTSSSWNSLPSDKLSVIVRLPNGRELEARFAYQKIEKNANREEAAFYFQFQPEHTPTVARLIGTDVTCELWFDYGQPVRIVPKLAMVMAKPAAFQAGNWSVGLANAFPGSRLAVEGQTDLGVILPTNKPLTQAAK